MIPLLEQKRLERVAALDLKVYSCNSAKWIIIDMVWLNLLEHRRKERKRRRRLQLPCSVP